MRHLTGARRHFRHPRVQQHGLAQPVGKHRWHPRHHGPLFIQRRGKILTHLALVRGGGVVPIGKIDARLRPVLCTVLCAVLCTVLTTVLAGMNRPGSPVMPRHRHRHARWHAHRHLLLLPCCRTGFRRQPVGTSAGTAKNRPDPDALAELPADASICRCACRSLTGHHSEGHKRHTGGTP